MTALKDLCVIWKTLVLFIIPAVASPILTIDGSKEMACLYGVVVMAAYWITEALPVAVTALCPVIIFSALGVLPAKEIAASYVKDAIMFSFACLTFALCVERWQLHKRIALGTMLLMGSSPKWLMLGFMLPTWFLSMWVNNTSATAMMIPVVTAVLNQLHEFEVSNQGNNGASDVEDLAVPLDQHMNSEKRTASGTRNENAPITYPNKEFKLLCKALSLCVCYAASIGGTGSVTGSSTNLIMQGQADEIFESFGLESGVNFLNWIICCIPVSVLCFICAWIWLVVHFFGVKELLRWECGDKRKSKATKRVINEHLAQLGPFSFAEKAVVGHFFFLLITWLSMKIPGGVGWSYFFEPGYVNNSTPGILVVMSLFIFPCERPKIFCWNKNMKDNKPPRSVSALLDWKTVHEHFPWGTWCLLGGGYAMANACMKSGLSLLIGSHLAVLSSLNPWVMVLILSLLISFMTEITSNAASASVLCPILAQLAISIGMNPLYILYPAVLSCSFAFMLPVATPPNALVFATEHVKTKDMVKAGLILNVLCVLIVNIGTNTWMTAFLEFDKLPPAMDIRFNTSELLMDDVNMSTQIPWNRTV